MTVLLSIATHIQEVTGECIALERSQAVGGGCINHSFRLSGSNGDYFVKRNHAHRLPMFEAEAQGLQVLQQCRSLRVPRVICSGVAAQDSYLVLEYIPLTGQVDFARAGQAVAQLHQLTAAQYGWFRDNTIGATLQQNRQQDDWITFYAKERLLPQLLLAEQNGGRLLAQGEKLLDKLAQFFPQQPDASLLHGDLWSGNLAFADSGETVVYDPAVYYGDREADIAMTELFGGFSPAFYQAYNEAYPLDQGYTMRKTLYNLYHILNHFNLFGGGYLGQAKAMLGQLLTAV